MKLPNGYGSISKMSGNRRKPYMVRITTGTVIDHENHKAHPKMTVLGYFATRKDALQALADYNDSPYNLDRNTITVQEIWDRIKDTVDASEDRKVVYDHAFNKYLIPIAQTRIIDVRTAMLQDVINGIQHGYSTKSNVRSVINHIFNYALQNDLVTQNYMKYVKFDYEGTQLIRDLYTPDEINELWNHSDLPEYALTIILLYEGMRIKELREMPKENVNLEKNTLKITRGKNAQSLREIPIHDRVRPLIESAMNTDGDKLFNMTARQYSYFTTQVLHHRAYDVRHTFASKANEIGMDKLIIKKIMGHKPESVLEQAYIHLSMDTLQQAINCIEY